MKPFRKLLGALLLAVAALPLPAQTDNALAAEARADSDTVCHEVLLETTKGNIRIRLFNDTPLHRDNFLKLVREGYYDGILWHRVIADFMIQTGDSTTRHAQPGRSVGGYSPDYSLPAEIVFPKHFHKRGAVAAAREPDSVNPERRSSSSQFYIVYGQPHGDMYLDECQKSIDRATGGTVKLTPEVRDAYRKYGGTPHLDGQYTVFGEVTEGLNVVRDIDFVKTDDYDRPIWDVKIVKATVIK